MSTAFDPSDPNTVCYIATPGGIATTRTLQQIRDACNQNSFEILEETVEGGMMTAITERMDGQPSIIETWDHQGRVMQTAYIGERGASSSRGVTNHYEFDDTGRLSRRYQVLHQLDGQDVLSTDYNYLYLPDRPDEEYNLRQLVVSDDNAGSYEVKDYEQRLQDNSRPPER